MQVKCLIQEHDAVSTARANEPIAQSRDDHLNHVATPGWMWVSFGNSEQNKLLNNSFNNTN